LKINQKSNFRDRNVKMTFVIIKTQHQRACSVGIFANCVTNVIYKLALWPTISCTSL
jgi:hypothetical protein